MTTPITVEQRPSGTGVIATVTVTGEIDYSNVGALQDALNQGHAAGGAVMVDLSRLEFIDSMGLGAILQASLRADDAGTHFAIVPSPFMERMIRAAGLEGRLATAHPVARLEATYPATPASVPIARATFADAFSDLPGTALNDGKVLLTELVTNAIRHGTRADGWVRLVVRELDQSLRIEVTDSGEVDGEPAIQTPRPDQVGGWGLRVVDSVATRWGVATEHGRTVWCELAIEASDPPADGEAPPPPIR
jgi:anti-anti-sigma factor